MAGTFKQQSVSMPQWMIDEVETRRAKGTSRSEYVRDALRRRWELEDEGEWEPPEDYTTDQAPADD